MIENNPANLQILREREKAASAAPFLSKRFEDMLASAFPEAYPADELFIKNTFTGEDEKDYSRFFELFNGKKWNEVNLDVLNKIYIQHSRLTAAGSIYYLPAFLKYFFDLKNTRSEFFIYLMFDLENGFDEHTSDELTQSLDGKSKLKREYSSFEKINPIQSKLVATFLVNFSNLLPEDCYESAQAQRALTNYWGNFLLF
ncbi:DUF6714 family protein [Acidovorax sp. NCPPB 4044]|uniref:DUF6714 family protein n=1 Tax=Acidovorax sp. NCPPB 4044 TaxID=2940490 RepID=UPI0023032074|nr:DUF6714 family protein [Acidovorax sp. NCPPB 4044]MDA8522171.1 hypothetical protein [Acidovorax sp. NCPPB 4044]